MRIIKTLYKIVTALLLFYWVISCIVASFLNDIPIKHTLIFILIGLIGYGVAEYAAVKLFRKLKDTAAIVNKTPRAAAPNDIRAT